jgi:hypothetical protein
MGATLWACRGRGVVVVLASGAAISLSALTGGIAPAFADPVAGPPTTPINPPVPAIQAPPRGAVPNIPAPHPPPPPPPPQPVAPPPQPAPRPVAAPPPARTVSPPPPARTVSPPPQEAIAPAPVITKPPAAPTTPAPVVTNPPAPPTNQAPVITKPPAPVNSAPQAPPTTAAAPPITTTVPAAPHTTVAAPIQPAPVTTAPNNPAFVPRSEPAPVVTGTAPPTAPAPPGGPLATQSPPGPSGQPTGRPPSETGTPTPPGESPGLRPLLVPRAAAGSSAGVPSASSPVSTAGQVVTVHQADKLQAPAQDVARAKAAVPAEYRPDPASAADVDGLRNKLRSPRTDGNGQNRDGHDWGAPDPGRADSGRHEWDRRVRQWDRDWVSYDDYWRPVICNPYDDTLQVVYVYENAPQIVVIPPYGSSVLDVPDYGAYNFTALLTDAVGQAVDTAVGNFFGGGYFPGPDLPLPPPPPPVLTYNDVPITVSYPDATYEPFVASQVVDVGDDAQYGEHKVLLDGVTPVWGQWSQTPDGQRQFEVHKTQQFPGLDTPQHGPLPGDYQLQLANKGNKPSPGLPARDVFVVAASAVVATLGVCGAVALGFSRRRARLRY